MTPDHKKNHYYSFSHTLQLIALPSIIMGRHFTIVWETMRRRQFYSNLGADSAGNTSNRGNKSTFKWANKLKGLKQVLTFL